MENSVILDDDPIKTEHVPSHAWMVVTFLAEQSDTLKMLGSPTSRRTFWNNDRLLKNRGVVGGAPAQKKTWLLVITILSAGDGSD